MSTELQRTTDVVHGAPGLVALEGRGRRPTAAGSLTAAVVVCAHDDKRLVLTERAVRSVLAGTVEPAQVTVVVDRNEPLRSELGRRLAATPVEVIGNEGDGAADARSTGTRHCDADVMAFLDDDAWAAPNWLERMLEPFAADAAVVGAGGLVLPEWEEGAAPLPPELLWIVGSTYRGHPEGPVPITRPIGASMAARRDAFVSVGGFPSDFGPRRGRKASSNEELAFYTELRRRFGPRSVVYVPDAVVYHHAPAARATWGYLARRSWVEGSSKADARRRFGADVMGHDSSYVRSVLLPATAGYLGRGVRQADRRSLRSAAMCATSLAVTAAGYGSRLARRNVPSAPA